MDSYLSSNKASIDLNIICHFILKHKDCPGITKRQIAVITDSSDSIPVEIKEALQETMYYQEIKNNLPEKLR